ncbi:MAG: hypothetical protein AAF383_04340 [Cyanobacteria bacterium P01_A01_bin.83]
MLKLKYLLNFLLVISLVGFGSCYANSDTDIAISQESESGLRVTGDCDVVFNEQTNEIELVSKITVAPESRARCIIRIQSPDPNKSLRLVPLALKGKVTKAPATLAVSSVLIGEDNPTSFAESYNKPTSFDLANEIPTTGHTTAGQNVFGINLTVSTQEGSLEITDLKFAIQ